MSVEFPCTATLMSMKLATSPTCDVKMRAGLRASALSAGAQKHVHELLYDFTKPVPEAMCAHADMESYLSVLRGLCAVIVVAICLFGCLLMSMSLFSFLVWSYMCKQIDWTERIRS